MTQPDERPTCLISGPQIEAARSKTWWTSMASARSFEGSSRGREAMLDFTLVLHAESARPTKPTDHLGRTEYPE